jgi:hypothetical protein
MVAALATRNWLTPEISNNPKRILESEITAGRLMIRNTFESLSLLMLIGFLES